MYDDGHMYCFACKYYEDSTNSLDKHDDLYYNIGVEGEGAASVDPPDLPWKPQETQDERAALAVVIDYDDYFQCGSS